MAKSYEKSGMSFQGMSKDAYDREVQIQKEHKQYLKDAKEIDKLKNSTKQSMEASLEAAKEMGYIEQKTSGNMLEQKILLAARNALEDGNLKKANEILKSKKGLVEQEKEFGKAVNEIFPGLMGWATAIEDSAAAMNGMFKGASIFNGNISNWDVSSVTDMNGMFYYATGFNQDLSSWDLSSVTNMN